jgi:bile acid:Na+ symporter, BASS family
MMISKLPVIIFLGMILGFIAPDAGLLLKPFLSYTLMIIMFFTCLKIDASDFRKIKVSTLLIALCLNLVFMPLLSVAGLIFGVIVFVGFLLSFACPSAASSAFYSDAYNGDSSLAIVLTTLTNLISIFSLPLTMLIGVGAAISFDVVPIITNLAQIILLPLLAALAVKKYFRSISEKIISYGGNISHALILLILWGGVSSGVGFIGGDMRQFLEVNVVLTSLFVLVITVAYLIGRAMGRKTAIAMAIATFMKNAILALVIGSAAFGSEILPVLVANLIDQNIILIVLGVFAKKK